MMRARALVASAALAIFGCGFSGSASMSQPVPDGDASTTDVDASSGNNDGKVHVVLVNGLTSRSDSGINDYQDVRVCFGALGAAALPKTGTMPLSNYPGVARGRGVDLGAIDQVPTQGSELHVFDANVVHGKADDACPALLAPSGGGSAAHQTLKFDQPLLGGKHYLLVLTEANGSMSLHVAALEDQYTGSSDGGTPAPVLAQFGLFSSWTKGPFSVQLQDNGAPIKVLATGVSQNVVVSAAEAISIPSTPSYDSRSLAFSPDVAGPSPAELVQSLASIQYVSDPTTNPLAFFDRRQRFVFVAVGDPNDLSVLVNGGRNPAFEGSGLHIVAVPYD